METMNQFAREDGQGLVEYVLIMALISISAIIVMALAGDSLINAYEFITNELISVPKLH